MTSVEDERELNIDHEFVLLKHIGSGIQKGRPLYKNAPLKPKFVLNATQE